MQIKNPMAWMLAEAVAQLQHADRLQRQFFRVAAADGGPSWEPPVDICADGRTLGVLVALPGVAPQCLEVVLEYATLVVRGERTLGATLGAGAILRLEIPYGRFERRIELPSGRYRVAEQQMAGDVAGPQPEGSGGAAANGKTATGVRFSGRRRAGCTSSNHAGRRGGPSLKSGCLAGRQHSRVQPPVSFLSAVFSARRCALPLGLCAPALRWRAGATSGLRGFLAGRCSLILRADVMTGV